MTEPNPCAYLISGRSGAGCGVPGDPFECPAPSAVSLPDVSEDPSLCFPAYDYAFRRDIGSELFSWDLHGLCRNDSEYTFVDGVGGVLHYNFCGNASQICAPGYETYTTHGVAVLLHNVSSDGGAACDANCTDFDFGVPTCCTGPCSILVSRIAFKGRNGRGGCCTEPS